MIKTISIRYIKSNILFARLRNSNFQYLNFSTKLWMPDYSEACRYILSEIEDTDPVESAYYVSLDIPSDAVSVEIFDSDGKVIADDGITLDLLNISNVLSLTKSEIDFIKSVNEGNWYIRDNQMIFEDLNLNEIMRFNLYDKEGRRSDSAVFTRTRV